jgi:immunoglobulin-like protein involved in spore germination
MVTRYSLILLLALLLIGCRPATPPPTKAPVIEATATAAAPTIPPDVAGLIRNAQYQLGTSDALQVVQLENGKFEHGAAGDPDYMSIQLTDYVTAGDLNGDGTDEIVALISENYGGSGVFVFLTVFTNDSDIPAFLASTLVDDRPQLNSLSIKNGEIFLDSVIHGVDDPMCCPALHVTRNYRLIDDQLDLTNYATFTPDGRPRTIQIEFPADGTEVSSSVQVKGSVAIAPFENNLAYSIKDGAGLELSRGAVQVTAADPGGLGTFDATIQLGNILSNTVIFIEIQDISAADGSLLGMDSVELVVK